MDSERRKRIDAFFATVNKRYGKGFIGSASQQLKKKVPRIPTGIIALDIATGGGLPVGRTSMLHGEKSSGKTTTALRWIAQAQQTCSNCNNYRTDVFDDKTGELTGYECEHCGKYREFVVGFLDVEGAYDRSWGELNGVDNDALLYAAPEFAEQGIDIADSWLRTGDIDAVVVDSLAMLVPATEIEESVTGDSWILAKDPKGAVHVVQVRDLLRLVKRREGWEVRGLKDTRFDWVALKKIWSLPKGKRIFEILTEYGNKLKVTEDHSVFRVKEVDRYRDKARKLDIRVGEPEEVKGSSVQVGDYLLMDVDQDLPVDKVEPLRVVDYLPSQRSSKQRFYAAHASMAYYAYRLPETKKNGWNLRNGVYGPALPVDVARARKIPVAGDAVLYTTGAKASCVNEIPIENLAYLVGLYLGDGYLTGRPNKSGIRIYAGLNPNKPLARLKRDLGKYVSPGPKLRQRPRGTDYFIEIGCRPLVCVFDQWFGTMLAPTKRVPKEVFCWPESAKRSFVRGLLDSDGHESRRGKSGYRCIITTTSEGLAYDIRAVLNSLGVVSGLQTRLPKSTTLVDHEGVLRDVIGRHKVFCVTFSGNALDGNSCGRQGRKKSSWSVSAGLPVKVLSVEEVPTERVYDLETESVSHTFVVNDLLVHNSIEKWQQGLQARLLNKACRKWNGALNFVGREFGRRPTLVLINQMRQKIGVMFSSPDVKPGGLGQEFITSVDVKFWSGPVETESKDKKPLWAVKRFKVIKNKVSPPNYQGEFTIMISDFEGKKIGDLMEEELVFDQSRALGLLKMEKEGGNIVLIGDERLNGKGQVVRYWMTHPDDFEDAKSLLLQVAIRA